MLLVAQKVSLVAAPHIVSSDQVPNRRPARLYRPRSRGVLFLPSRIAASHPIVQAELKLLLSDRNIASRTEGVSVLDLWESSLV